MNNERDLINEWLEDHIEGLDKNHVHGSESYDEELSRILDMAKVAIEYDKVMLDADKAKVESEMQEKTLFTANTLDLAKTVARISADIACAVMPYMLYQKWLKWGFEFEEKGVFTSHTFKGLFNRMKPDRF